MDDTDSPEGGCTTYMPFHILEKYHEFNLIGLPALVRLNPNIPYKTRGNGAVCVRLGKGKGRARVVGMHNDREIRAYPAMEEEVHLSPAEVLDTVLDLLEERSRMEDENTNPGAVVSTAPIEREHYLMCAREMVSKYDADKALNSLPPYHLAWGGLKNGRGVVGASGALSWCSTAPPQVLFPFDDGPAPVEPPTGFDSTYEVLAYRERSGWGSTRSVDPASALDVDARFPGTFSNFDEVTGKPLITPHTPCPILFGVRGDDAAELMEAKDVVKAGEPCRSWLLYATNQATDDHIRPRALTDVRTYESVAVEGLVCTDPVTVEGGHVIFSLGESIESCKDEEKGGGGQNTPSDAKKAPKVGRTIDCAAYEPTKGFRDIARQLAPGDRILVYGGVRVEPLTVNIEKMKVLEVAQQVRKVGNPKCPG